MSMLTVLIECRDQESELAQTLTTLVAGAVEGLICDVVILDHGSNDGTARLADAAGCRFHRSWDLPDIISAARGEWLLLIEPGARPSLGWIEETAEYIALNSAPARFARSRHHKPSLLHRVIHRYPPLERGLLLRKTQARALSKPDMALADLVAGLRIKALSSEIVPAWATRAARA